MFFIIQLAQQLVSGAELRSLKITNNYSHSGSQE